MADLPEDVPDRKEVAAVFARYLAFADGFAARVPGDEEVVGDMRYSITPSFHPAWGVRTRPGERPLWIDNEFIHCLQLREDDGAFVIEACERGHLKTIPAAHAAETKVRIVYFSGYRNVFPGTVSLCEAIAENIGRVAREGNFTKITATPLAPSLAPIIGSLRFSVSGSSSAHGLVSQCAPINNC